MEYNVAVEVIPSPYTSTVGKASGSMGFGGTFPRNRIVTLPPPLQSGDSSTNVYDSDSSFNDDSFSNYAYIPDVVNKRKSPQVSRRRHRTVTAAPKSLKRRFNFAAVMHAASKKRAPLLAKTFMTSSNVSLTSRQTEASSGYYSPTPSKRGFDTQAVIDELWTPNVSRDRYQTFGISEPEMNEYLDCLESQFQQEVWGRCFTKQKSYSANDINKAGSGNNSNKNQNCFVGSRGANMALYDDNGEPARSPANLAYALEMYYNLYTTG